MGRAGMSKLGNVLDASRTFGVREGVLRLEYELQRSSGLMSRKMRSVEGWSSWELARVARVPAQRVVAAWRERSDAFFFPDIRGLRLGLQQILGADGEASVIDQAEKILAGQLPYFGRLNFDCGFPPRWFKNPVTGQSVSPKQSWTRMRFSSPVYGDLKFILEPSRFLFLYPLTRAFALSGDERFAEAFWKAVEDWAAHNPPMAGPMWICGQECSLRIFAWSFALHAFAGSPATTDERVALLTSMVAAHAWRTAQTLGYARSQRSNHLISEAAGLWTAGTLYPDLKEAQTWQDLGAELLGEAVHDQITPGGVSQQHSFNYQRMILHVLLWTIRLSEIRGGKLSDDIRSRAMAAYEFMRTWVDPTSGLVPICGSDDGSLILPLAQAEYRDFRPLLQLSSSILGGTALPRGPWDEASLWFGAESAATPRTADRPIYVMSDNGYHRIGDQTSWALIRAGQYTRRPYQADQLHVDLWWKGANLACDAGTYSYNAPPPWDNALAGTSVHNTVTIDGRDQMRRAGRFLWRDWAQATGEISLTRDGQPIRFAGQHDGYRQLGVTHRRTVQWLPEIGWIIVDDLLGSGEHNVRLHWLLADLPFEVSDRPFEITLAQGPSRIRWTVCSDRPASAGIIRGGKKSWETGTPLANDDETSDLLGWQAPGYGDLQPAVSVVYSCRSQLPLRLATCVLTDESCAARIENRHLIVVKVEKHGEVEIYRAPLDTSAAVPTNLSEVHSPTV